MLYILCIDANRNLRNRIPWRYHALWLEVYNFIGDRNIRIQEKNVVF